MTRNSSACATAVAAVLLLTVWPLFASGGGENASASAPATLELLIYGASLTDAYNEMGTTYKAASGDTLNFTILAGDQQTVLRARLNSGNIPDLFMTSAYADNVGYKDYIYNLTNEDFIKKLQPSTLSGVTVGSEITGFPWLVQSYSFIYNKKVFADAGITSLPRTLAEYETTAKALQAKGVQPFATGYRSWWVLPQTAWPVLAPTIEARYGGYAKFVDQMTSGTLKFKDVKEMSTIFDLLDLIKKYGGSKPLESDSNDQYALMAAGKTGIIHQGDWAERSIRKIVADAQIGFLLTPVAEGQDKAGLMMDSNQTMRVAKDGKNLQHALAFLRWVVTSDYGRDWIPVKADGLSPIIGAKAPRTVLDQETLELLSKNTPAYPWYYQRFPTGLEQGLGIVLQGYAAGQTDRQQTLAALDATYAKAAAAAK